MNYLMVSVLTKPKKLRSIPTVHSSKMANALTALKISTLTQRDNAQLLILYVMASIQQLVLAWPAIKALC